MSKEKRNRVKGLSFCIGFLPKKRQIQQQPLLSQWQMSAERLNKLDESGKDRYQVYRKQHQ